MSSPEFFALQAAIAGRYSLVRELGRGGMGIVFLARDVALDRPVAIKLLPPALAADLGNRRRFLREARTAASLSHPHIVPIHAVEEHGDLVFLVMAFVDGETLGERVRRAGPLPVREAIRVFLELSWALGHAHARRVIHRDIKPDNILLERESGRALVTDFGIAAAAGTETSMDGRVAGTPAYMSPEQAAGAEPDARADLYAAGVTAWYAMVGTLPFQGRDAMALVVQHAATPVPSLTAAAPRVPLRLAALVERSMAKAPDDRPRDANELAAGLEAIRGGAIPVIAAPVRTFLREADAAVREMGVMATAAGVTGGLAVALRLFTSGINQSILSSIFGLAMVLAAGAGAVRLGQILEAARALLRQGYDHRALASAARTADQEQHEEREIAAAIHPRSRREGLGLVALGAIKSALFVAIALGSWGPGWLQGVAIVGAVVLPTVTLRKLWQLLRPAGGRWLRVLSGSAGRILLSVAGIGLGVRRTAPGLGAGESTVVAIGEDAQALFLALPAADQERLAGLRAVLSQLAADARLLHRAADQPGATQRLATVAAALDALRLDLMRIRAGTLSAIELTEQVEVVARLHDELQLRDEAEQSVERFLARPDPTPT